MIGKCRAGRRRRQARDIDIVLHRDRHAIEWQFSRPARQERPRLGKHVGFLAQADEYGGIAMSAERKATRHRFFRRSPPRSMYARYFSDRLGHAVPA
jgi:hypothetical protein